MQLPGAVSSQLCLACVRRAASGQASHRRAFHSRSTSAARSRARDCARRPTRFLPLLTPATPQAGRELGTGSDSHAAGAPKHEHLYDVWVVSGLWFFWFPHFLLQRPAEVAAGPAATARRKRPAEGGYASPHRGPLRASAPERKAPETTLGTCARTRPPLPVYAPLPPQQQHAPPQPWSMIKCVAAITVATAHPTQRNTIEMTHPTSRLRQPARGLNGGQGGRDAQSDGGAAAGEAGVAKREGLLSAARAGGAWRGCVARRHQRSVVWCSVHVSLRQGAAWETE